MTTTIKITELTNIGANLASSTVFPVVNMAGTPTTEKTVLGNIANVILGGAGNAYVAVGVATVAGTVTTNAQPNITSIGNLTGLTVSNAAGTVNFSNTANVTLGNVSNLHIAGGTAGQLLSTNGNGTLSWASDTTTYGNSNVVSLMASFGSNTIITTGNITGGNINISNGYANVTGPANTVGGGATVGVRSILAIDSAFGSNDANDPASAQAIRGRVTGANLTKTRNYVTGVTGQYLVTGTNASEFIKAGVLGVVGDKTTTADGAVVAYLDGDGGLTTANAAYAVSMKNSTPNSGFNYGLDLQFINLNVAGTTTTFKQADIRFNNGVTLVANTAGNISINANVTVGNIIATNIGNIANINLDGSNSNVLYGNGVFAPASGGGANTGNWAFDDNTMYNMAGGEINNGDPTHGATAGLVLPENGNAGLVTSLFNTYGNVQIAVANLANSANTSVWNFGVDGNLTLPNTANVSINYANGSPYGGGGSANTGNVTFDDNIVIGTGDEFGFSGLYLAVGPDSIANGTVQYLRVRGGDAPTHIHLDTGNNQFYDQYFGDDAKYVKLELGDAGNIVVGTDDATGNLYNWTFTSDGNFILANGNSVIQSIANSSLDPLNPNVSTMVLTPDPGYGSQALVLDPTAPGHIHLRAPGANIDEPSANIFLGGEDSSFEVGYYNGSAPNLFIHSNNNTWMFDIDGNITLPSGGDILVDNGKIISADGEDFIIIVQDSNDDGNRLDLVVTDGTDQATRVEVDIDGMQIHTNLLDVGNSHYWGFKSDGNLNLPGNLVIAGNANVFGTNSSLLQTTDNRPLIALSSGANGAVSSLWVEDIGNVGTSNIAAVYANPTVGSGIVRIAVGQNGVGSGPNLWDFDAAGNLTIPSTSGGFIKTASNASIGIAAMDNGTNNPAQLLSINVGNSNATSIISAYATNATIQTNASGNINTWQFDNAGNLTLPTGGQIIVSGGLVSSGASPAPTINGFSITNSVGISGNGNIAGNNISATGNISANNFTGNGGTLSNVATKIGGSWTLASGVNTVNISVPLNGTYAIWVNGNIPNGIVTYTATAVVTNTNVPVLGEQYAWYYSVGNALVFTSIPNQFTGTVGSISTVNTYAGNTANVFTFGITNNSGNTAVVNYGYTKL